MFRSRSHAPGYEIDDAVLTVTEDTAVQLDRPLPRRRAVVFLGLTALVLSVFAGRAFFLAVMERETYEDIARRQSVRLAVSPAPRGIIYDRSGQPLVENVPSLDLMAVPADVPADTSGREALLERLRSVFALSEEARNALLGEFDPKGLSPLLLKEGVTQEEALLFATRARELPGVVIAKTARRQYVDSAIFSHILGYEGKLEPGELKQYPGYLMTDLVGKQGLEKSYEAALHGTHGGNKLEVDALGRVKKDLGLLPPTPGSDLTLAIDAELQKKAFDALSAQIEKSGLKAGALVAIDPRDGGVLALASYPSFDNNLFSRGIQGSEFRALLEDPAKPLFNRALSGEYPPGSTWKPVVAAAALAEGTINEGTRVEGTGGIQVGRFFFGDWKVHGLTDVRQAIAVSSDTFFYALGGGWAGIPGLGIARMKSYAERFGFGRPTGIDLPGEADGLVPDQAWKKERFGERWYVGDDYHAAIGQGYILATPLQLANMTAAIANGGILYEPRLVTQIRRPDGTLDTRSPRTAGDRVVSPDILRVIREGMRETVAGPDGTARPLQNLPVAVAGKTGTAQYGGAKATHGWFISFAPYEDPVIAMAVLVEGQESETYNAVPVTAEIYRWYFEREKTPETSQEQEP